MDFLSRLLSRQPQTWVEHVTGLTEASFLARRGECIVPCPAHGDDPRLGPRLAVVSVADGRRWEAGRFSVWEVAALEAAASEAVATAATAVVAPAPAPGAPVSTGPAGPIVEIHVRRGRGALARVEVSALQAAAAAADGPHLFQAGHSPRRSP